MHNHVVLKILCGRICDHVSGKQLYVSKVISRYGPRQSKRLKVLCHSVYTPFGHKSAHFCVFFRSMFAKEKYILSAWRHLSFKSVPALSEVVDRALEVVNGALKYIALF